MSLTAQQLAMRRTGVGASQSAALLGVNPWMTKTHVYRSICGPYEVVDGPDVERGTLGEPFIARWAALRYQWNISFPGTLRHPEHPLVLATPDGIINDRQLLECKYPRDSRSWRDEDGQLCPPFHHQIQCQQGMAVTGLKSAELVAILDGDIHRFRIDFDPDIFYEIRRAIDIFWARHILPRRPPDPDGTAAYTDYLKDALRDVKTELVEDNDPKLGELFAELQAAAEAVKAAEAAKEQARQRLMLAIGDRAGVRTAFGGQVGTAHFAAPSARKTIRYEDLIHEQGIRPEVVARYTDTVEGKRTLRTFFKRGKTSNAE